MTTTPDSAILNLSSATPGFAAAVAEFNALNPAAFNFNPDWAWRPGMVARMIEYARTFGSPRVAALLEPFNHE